MVFFKTVCNSWACSARYHDGGLARCAFGCVDELDSLDHYLVCPSLWQMVQMASAHLVSDNVLRRLCIFEPSPNDLCNLVIAYTIYHTLKASHLQDIREACNTLDFNNIHALCTNIARAAAERYQY